MSIATKLPRSRSLGVPLSLALAPEVLQSFRELFGREVGLRIDDDRIHSFISTISDRAALLGISDLGVYHQMLSAPEGASEFQELLDLFTVGETYFFRVPSFFSFFQETVLPDVLHRRERSGQKSLGIWSAACASGEEPYSIAMSLLDHGVYDAGWDVQLLATDVSRVALQRAEEGLYSSWAFRAVAAEDEAVAPYFRADGARYRISDTVRERVQFQRLNLHDTSWPFPAQGTWDVIFLRNVLMYFTAQSITDVLDRAHSCLDPEGYLFIGECESLGQLTERFDVIEHDGVYAYRPARSRQQTVPRDEAPHVAPGEQRGLKAAADTVTSTVPSRQTRPSTGIKPRPTPILGCLLRPTTEEVSTEQPLTVEQRVERLLELALDDFSHERNEQALLTLQRVVELAPSKILARLTIANIHTSAGRYEPAIQECLAVQQIDPLCAAAYLLHGIIHFEREELHEAQEQLRRAIYLEQDLCLGWYFSGKVSEAFGHRAAALRYYERALRTARRRGEMELKLGFNTERLIRVLGIRCDALRLEQRGGG